MQGVYRILITGSRTWTDRAAIQAAIQAAIARAHAQGLQPVVIHGCAGGADRLADQAALALGAAVERVPVTPARWKQLGKRAGFARNADMVGRGADECLTFALPCTLPACTGRLLHPTHGTAQCAALARKAGIPLTHIGLAA